MARESTAGVSGAITLLLAAVSLVSVSCEERVFVATGGIEGGTAKPVATTPANPSDQAPSGYRALPLPKKWAELSAERVVRHDEFESRSSRVGRPLSVSGFIRAFGRPDRMLCAIAKPDRCHLEYELQDGYSIKVFVDSGAFQHAILLDSHGMGDGRDISGGDSQYVAEKVAGVEVALRLLGELAGIAKTHQSHYPGPELQAKIRELLKPLKTVEDLARFALLSSALAGSQRAEHQNVDSVFDYAQWACLYRIATIPGDEAHVWLNDILRPILGRDGHPSEEFGELVASQARLAMSP
jgi:hypothetical protein